MQLPPAVPSQDVPTGVSQVQYQVQTCRWCHQWGIPLYIHISLGSGRVQRSNTKTHCSLLYQYRACQ